MEREQSRLATELPACSWKTVMKLVKTPELFKQYDEIIQDQLNCGIIEKVSSTSPEDLITFPTTQ